MTRATAAPLIFGAAVVVAAEFVVIGLLPAMSRELAMTPAQAGWLITVFALASALLGPSLVAVAARRPAPPVLALSLVPFAANLLMLAFPGFQLALALRVFQGAALPLFMSLAAARLGSTHGAGRGVALLYSGVTIGGTLAPPTGSFLAERLGWQAPMAIIGLLALIAALGCLALAGQGQAKPMQSPWRLLARPAMQGQLLLSALAFAAMFSGFSYLALLLGNAGLDSRWIAIALLAFGVAGLGGNWFAGRLADHALPATAGSALVAVAMTLLIANPAGSLLVAVAVLGWGAAHAAGFVFCQVRVMSAAPEAPAFAGSLNIAAANIGIALGSFAGGTALDHAGVPVLAAVACAFAALAAATALLCRQRNVAQSSSFRNQTDIDIAPE